MKTIVQQLQDAFASEDQAKFEDTLKAIQGKLPNALVLPEGWFANNGDFHDVEEYEFPKNIKHTGTYVQVILRNMTTESGTAETFCWNIRDSDTDIILWKVNS